MSAFKKIAPVILFVLFSWPVNCEEAENSFFSGHRFGVGLSLGSEVFGISGTVYSMTQFDWLMIETHLSYDRESGEIDEIKFSDSQIFLYSAAVLQLRLDPLVPYLGAGPGVVNFDRKYDGQSLSQGTTGGFVSFAGAKFFLSKQFGVDARVSMFSYLGAGPKDFENHDQELKSSEPKLEVGAFLYL